MPTLSKVLSSVFYLLIVSSFLYAEEKTALDHALIGVYAVNTQTGEVLLDENSDKSLMPASCLKVVTTAAALHLLGPETRFETCLEYDGMIDGEKTLHGNLYIRGGGDPCLGSDRIAGSLSWQDQIQAWVEAVQTLGIQQIEGEVLSDATKWEKALAVPSWAWEDLGNYYGAGACALSFHENYYTLFFKPASKVGEAASILRTDPPIPLLTFQNEVTTGPIGSGDNACIYGSEFSSTQAVRGTIPAGVGAFAIKGAIPDPAGVCAALLAKALQDKGIVIAHQKKLPLSKKEVFHTTYSPCIADIVYWTNQESINLYAEHLLKKIGEVVSHAGTTAAGVKAVKAFWEAQHIDLSGFNMVDGSGLSRKNLVTAKQLVSILLHMKKSEFFSDFLQSLPQKDEGRRAKSGSMSLVKGSVGYADNVAFAILANQCLDQKSLKEKISQLLNEEIAPKTKKKV